MARVPRSRSRPVTIPGGSAIWYKSGAIVKTASTPTLNFTNVCHDSVGRPVGPSSLQIEGYFGTNPVSVSGSVQPASFSLHDNVTFYDLALGSMPGAWTGATPPAAPAGWMLDLVAGTNPSRPVLNIPEAVENIVSLPRMLKSAGDAILSPLSKASPKKLAGEYLGFQFGWRPLIEDLTKLSQLQTYVNKRNMELNQLYDGDKGSRRRLKFVDTTEVVDSKVTYVISGATTATVAVSTTLRKRSWATITWKPTSPPPYDPADEGNTRLLRRIALGATPEGMANGLWKVIPWSWMLGWFTNFGKYTLAHSWTVPATHGTGCFMSSVEATSSAVGVTVSNARGHNLSAKGKAVHYKKTRVVSSSVSSGVNVPYIDTFRLSILSSLFTQRFAGVGRR